MSQWGFQNGTKDPISFYKNAMIEARNQTADLDT
jgi:hypothetical protein